MKMKKIFSVVFIFSLILSLLTGCNFEDVVSHDDVVSNDDKGIYLSEQKSASASQVKMTAGGYAHTIALCEDGTVWGWGNDFYGCICSGTPMQIKGLSDIVYVAAGNFASAAIKSDGTLWMWGAGWTSDVVTYSYSLSLNEPYMTDVTDVSIGDNFTAALKSDGTVWIWGSNGSDSMEEQKIPKKVEGLPEIKKIATSWSHAAFMDVNGNVWFLETQYIMPWVPKMVKGLSEITSITGGGHHFVALKSDGAVCTFAAADNSNQIDGLLDIVDIAAGAFHSVAVKKDGTVWSWGELEHGLGDGINEKSETPVKVATITNATGVASGNWHVIVTASDALWAWGNNYMGQLGYGIKPDDPYDTSTNRKTPVQVNMIQNYGSDDSSSPTDSCQSKPADTSNENSQYETSSHGPLNANGFVAADLDDIRRKIDMNDTDIVKYYDPDPSEFLPLYAPFLQMDVDTLFSILETIKKYDWEPYDSYINPLEARACEIALVCENTVITYLKFAKDADGRCYVLSEYDDQIAYLSETDYQEIREKFEAASEWPEKYYERYGYWHYSEYKES